MKKQGGEKKVSTTFAVTSDKPKGWDELALTGEVYHTGDFLHHFFTGVYYLTASTGGKLVGGIPLVQGMANGMPVVASLPRFITGGPIAKNKKLKERLVRRLKGQWFVSDYSGDNLNLPNQQEKEAEIIYFKSYEEWLKSIDEDARNQVRQASRRGVVLSRRAKKDEIAALDRETATRHGRGVDQAWTDSLVSFAQQHGATLLARKGKKAIAAIIVFKHGTRAYLVKNISATGSLKYRPNHFLYSEAVRWAVANGCTQLNTGGAEYAGLRQFKRSLGSRPFTYYWYSS